MASSLGSLSEDFRPWAVWLFDVARHYQLHPVVTSGYRSVAKQEQLYRRFLAGQSQFPAARPGCSLHNYGLAFDMVTDNNPWLGKVWQSVGGQWFSSDSVHYQAPIRSPCA